MKAYKAPRSPNGFQPFFFKKFWHILGDDVWELAKQVSERGWFDERLLESLLILIPKGDSLIHFNQFRSISLCNVVYKLITKVLVRRLRPYLGEVVGLL